MKSVDFSAIEHLTAVQGHSRWMILVIGTNPERVCDFLLVRHCDYGSVLHRFWLRYSDLLAENCPSLIRRPHSLYCLWKRGENNDEETSHRCILQWRLHDRSLSHFDTIPACDGRTCYDLLATGLPCANRQTDRLAQTLVCKAAVRPMRGFVGCFGH